MLQRESGNIGEKYLLWEKKIVDGQEMSAIPLFLFIDTFQVFC